MSVFILRTGTRIIRFSALLSRAVFGNDRPLVVSNRVWIDVGAHRGETTFEYARTHPEVIVYAFEPDISVASHRYALLRNFIVIAMAVSDRDGFSEFNVNSNDMTSSLLPLDAETVPRYRGAEGIRTLRRVMVPTIRLDTFLNQAGITRVEYLKVDAQGHDLEVLRSLGDRISDVASLRVEVSTSNPPMYRGANNGAEDVIAFMLSQGFEVTENVPQGQEANLTFRQRATPDLDPCVAKAKR